MSKQNKSADRVFATLEEANKNKPTEASEKWHVFEVRLNCDTVSYVWHRSYYGAAYAALTAAGGSVKIASEKKETALQKKVLALTDEQLAEMGLVRAAAKEPAAPPAAPAPAAEPEPKPTPKTSKKK